MAKGWYRSIDSTLGLVGTFVGVLIVLVAASPSVLGAPVPAPERMVPIAPGGLADFSVVVAVDRGLTEPGVPVTFSAIVLGGTAPFRFDWSDSTGNVGSLANFSSVTVALGNLTATVSVHDVAGGLAAATYTEPVVPGIDVEIAATNVTDVGIPFDLSVVLSGGVPPYHLDLEVDGVGLVNETLLSAGSYSLLAVSSTSGPIAVLVRVSDDIGATQSASVPKIALAAAPALAVVAGPVLVESGVPCSWLLSETGGSPPFTWTVDSTGAPGNSTGPNASSSSPGPLRWFAEFSGVGNATVRISVTDAAGLGGTLVLPLQVVPRLAAYLSTPAGDGSLAAFVNVSIDGGIAPYAVLLSATDTEIWVGNSSHPGSFRWSLAPRSTGPLNVTLRVTDAAGVIAVAVLGLAAPTNAPPPAGATSADPAWSIVTVIGLLLSVGVAAALARRRLVRHRDPDAVPPVVPAIEEVRRIFEESDALERESLYLQGEDRGVSRDSTEAGIAHWLQAGRIESVRGAGGEPLLRWVDDATPAPPERA